MCSANTELLDLGRAKGKISRKYLAISDKAREIRLHLNKNINDDFSIKLKFCIYKFHSLETLYECNLNLHTSSTNI